MLLNGLLNMSIKINLNHMKLIQTIKPNKFHSMSLNFKRKKKTKPKVKIVAEWEFHNKFSDHLIKNNKSKLNAFLNLNKLNF